jgi:hypothetical protein
MLDYTINKHKIFNYDSYIVIRQSVNEDYHPEIRIDIEELPVILKALEQYVNNTR